MKIFVKVKPSYKKEETKQIDATHFEIKVKSPPQEGRANRATIIALAKYLGIPKSKIQLILGEKSRQKIFQVS